MTFKEAYYEMLKGNCIARKGWEGYWFMHPQTGKVIIRLASDEELVNKTDDLALTLQNVMAEDWIIIY